MFPTHRFSDLRYLNASGSLSSIIDLLKKLSQNRAPRLDFVFISVSNFQIPKDFPVLEELPLSEKIKGVFVSNYSQVEVFEYFWKAFANLKNLEIFHLLDSFKKEP